MSEIPGSLLHPVDDEDGEGISLISFTGDPVHIPESHIYGNCRRISDFEILDKIEEGLFGTVDMCRDKRTGEICALKKFEIPSDFKNGVPKSIIREFNILKSLNHVNMINSHGPVATSNLDDNYLILDYCRFSLKDAINENSPIYENSVVKCIMQQLFTGLAYIHSAYVIHRDISIKNIVFNDEGILKITGFQSSRFFCREPMSPGKSELRYRAPELLFNSKTYDMKVDMWSAGCLFSELVARKPLFNGDEELGILKNIFWVIGTPSENVWPGFNELFARFSYGLYEISNPLPYSSLRTTITGVSTPCYNIIKSLLIYYSKARMSAKECLEDAYFKEDPPACSTLHLASILKDMKEPAETPVTPTKASD